MARFRIPRRAAFAFLLFERYGLSAFFLWLAWQQLAAVRFLAAALPAGSSPLGDALPDFTRHVLVLFFDLLVGLLLLTNRPPSAPPEVWADVLVPLAANFFYLSYNVAAVLPRALNENLLPAVLSRPLSVLALYLFFLGFALATWSVVWLGRSFAVLISVRKIVVGGPYRFVRHPMYLSYVLQMAAFVCAYGSALVMALTTGHLLLTIYRARLEERRLGEHSPAYREYAERTGFLFPKWSGGGG